MRLAEAFPEAREALGIDADEADPAERPSRWDLSGGRPVVRFGSRHSDGVTLRQDGAMLRQSLVDGGWKAGSTNSSCKNPLTGAPRTIDEIIRWGGPYATFRWDNATDVDFKWLSVREIQP